MAFERTCAQCGTPFLAQGNRAMFCKTCAKERAKAQIKARDLRRKEARQARRGAPGEEHADDTALTFCDSPENIAAVMEELEF